VQKLVSTTALLMLPAGHEHPNGVVPSRVSNYYHQRTFESLHQKGLSSTTAFVHPTSATPSQAPQSSASHHQLDSSPSSHAPQKNLVHCETAPMPISNTSNENTNIPVNSGKILLVTIFQSFIL